MDGPAFVFISLRIKNMSHHQLGVGFYWDDLTLGDTLHVQFEVIDLKPTSKPDRALI